MQRIKAGDVIRIRDNPNEMLIRIEKVNGRGVQIFHGHFLDSDVSICGTWDEKRYEMVEVVRNEL